MNNANIVINGLPLSVGDRIVVPPDTRLPMTAILCFETDEATSKVADEVADEATSEPCRRGRR